MTLTITQPPTTILWLTDIHLDRAKREDTERLLGKISKIKYGALIITGDISTAPFLAGHLRELAESCAPRNLFGSW